MSAIEPDAAAAHLFPHWREAVRAWWAHRQGQQCARPALGAVRGKGPSVGDVLRVGQLLADLDLLTERGLTTMGKRLVACALDGGAGRSDDRALQSAVQRVERWGRKTRIIAKPARRHKTRRDSWLTECGVTMDVTYCVETS